MKVFLKILMWVLIVAVAVFLVLQVTVMVTKEFNTIPELLNYLVEEFRQGGRAGAIFARVPLG